jgi:nucleotide-binding universal stress UspA family protein
MYYGVLEPDREALMGMLMAVAPKNTSVPVERRLLIGNPADEIVKVAHDEHVDMIVMGTHGRTGWQHMLMGSVAEVVVRKAECPVLTLRMSVPAKAAT